MSCYISLPVHYCVWYSAAVASFVSNDAHSAAKIFDASRGPSSVKTVLVIPSEMIRCSKKMVAPNSAITSTVEIALMSLLHWSVNAITRRFYSVVFVKGPSVSKTKNSNGSLGESSCIHL